jgi:DNA adenine methylase
MTNSTLKSPYAWFGGKSRVAKVIWSGLGQVANYVEPFAGSLAVLLASPQVPKIETINDLDHGLINFWRAVSQNPEEVAKLADYPVTEADLHARHQYLISTLTEEFRQKMEADPNFFDIKMASYWIYGQSASVGSNWLQPKGLKALPLLSSAGGGIHGLTYDIQDQFKKLQQRLKRVRVACGDWKRLISPSITYNNVGLSPKDMTAVFLDPPYSLNDRDKVYKEESNIFQEVCQWAIDNGDNPRLRIALCGYEGDHPIPGTWQVYSWAASGGMANLGNDRGQTNKLRERIWFSPNCLEIK